jgi:hypothetical protein
MNWSRGFFRLWVFFAVLWWTLTTIIMVHDRQHLGQHEIEVNILTPLIVLAIGAFLGWALKGFDESKP